MPPFAAPVSEQSISFVTDRSLIPFAQWNWVASVGEWSCPLPMPRSAQPSPDSLGTTRVRSAGSGLPATAPPAAIASELQEISASILRREQELGEKRLARARLWVCAVGLLSSLAYLFYSPAEELEEQFRTALLMGAAVLYAYVWLVYMERVRFRRYHRYVSSTLDLLLIALANLIWSMYRGADDLAAQLQFSAGFGSLLVLVILTGFRFDYKTVLYIATLTFVGYAAYVYYGASLPAYRLTTSWRESFLNPGVFNVRDLLSRLLILFLAGGLMSYLIRRVGLLLRSSVAATVKKEQLRQFVSSSVASEIESGRARLDLSGRMMRTAILFCDIRGFTRLSERMDPQALLLMLNRYYEYMTEEIFRHEGTLDKYLGDGVMALFGAPRKLENCSESAVSCALAMLERTADFNRRYRYDLAVGIGIHTARVLVGNLGTQMYKNYTAIGDGVNTAARIESATRKSRARLLVSKETADDVREHFVVKSMGRFALKGKRGNRTLYTVGSPISKGSTIV